MSFNVPPARNRALRIDFSPETLQAKVQELETYRTLVQKTQRLQEAQKRKEDLAAKKLLRTEMKLAARLLKRAELEASKVSKSLSQAEQQAELAATRRRESILQLDIAAAKAQSRCNELSTVLSEKFAEVAEAKSRLTNVELQAQMMELGVALHGLEPQEEAAAVYEENQRLVSEVRELRAWRSSEEAKEGSASESSELHDSTITSNVRGGRKQQTFFSYLGRSGSSNAEDDGGAAGSWVAVSSTWGRHGLHDCLRRSCSRAEAAISCTSSSIQDVLDIDTIDDSSVILIDDASVLVPAPGAAQAGDAMVVRGWRPRAEGRKC